MRNISFRTNRQNLTEVLKVLLERHRGNDIKLDHNKNEVIYLYDFDRQTSYKIHMPKTEHRTTFLLETVGDGKTKILFEHVYDVPVNEVQKYIKDGYEEYRCGCGAPADDDSCTRFALATNCEKCDSLVTHFIKKIA